MADIYRLILFTPRPGLGYPEGGSYDTGANYPGCSVDNPGACHAVQFNHLEDAVAHAKNNKEIPVLVSNEADVWAILAGQIPITDNMIVPDDASSSGKALASMFGGLDTNTVIAIGVGALFLLPKLFRKRGAS